MRLRFIPLLLSTTLLACSRAPTISTKPAPDDWPKQAPIIDAIVQKNLSLATKLLRNGADPNAREILVSKPSLSQNTPGGVRSLGDTALIKAVDIRSVPLVKLLLESKADPNIQGEGGYTPLMTACQRDSIDTLTLLLKNGAKPNVINYYGDTAMTFAANGDYVDIVKALVESGADVRGGAGVPALTMAAQSSAEKTVRYLLKNGADPNYLGGMDRSPLDYAIESDSTEIIEMLRSAGAKGGEKAMLQKKLQKELERKAWEASASAPLRPEQPTIKTSAPRVSLTPEDLVVVSAAMTNILENKDSDGWSAWNKKLTKIVLLNEIGREGSFLNDSQVNADLDDKQAHDFSLEIRKSFSKRTGDVAIVDAALFNDSRILVRPQEAIFDKREYSDGSPQTEKLQAFGWIHSSLPGYSIDGTAAILRCGFGPTSHGGTLTIFLKKVDGNWQVMWREFAYYA
ncbi:MAG: ankyrin repeat domain-containing protein [Armatimonadetes bacterium]|nr:ankyrin repeat domain-containing protein [Armatimonadota bacterium]